jgi:excisionase family DNA binding protein
MQSKKMRTVKELAHELGVSPSTVRRIAKKNNIPGYREFGLHVPVKSQAMEIIAGVSLIAKVTRQESFAFIFVLGLKLIEQNYRQNRHMLWPFEEGDAK